jgi:hypothetical protein
METGSFTGVPPGILPPTTFTADTRPVLEPFPFGPQTLLPSDDLTLTVEQGIYLANVRGGGGRQMGR